MEDASLEGKLTDAHVREPVNTFHYSVVTDICSLALISNWCMFLLMINNTV